MPNLILSRRAGESILIGEAIEVTVLEIDGGQARISIQAPSDVQILRAELKARDAPAPGKVKKSTVLIRRKQRKLPA